MIYFGLILAGLLLGSFINALIHRLYRQDILSAHRQTKRSAMEQKKLSIVYGRSMCMQCGHHLAPKDLVPVLSWLSLRGKCRYCKNPIDDTPVAELIVPFLLVVSYIYWPYASGGWPLLEVCLFGIWTLVVTCFVALSIYDAKWFLLPNRIVLPLTVLSALVAVFVASVGGGGGVALAMAGAGGLTISGIFYVLSYVSKGSWIGGGDIKIGIALGLLAGTPLMALLVIFLASLLGSAYMLPGIISGKQGMKSMLPFGPFLIVATYVVFLWGGPLFAWYTGLFLQ